METGPGLITGDTFGSEARLVVTAVLAIGTVITMRLLSQNPATDPTEE